MVMAIHISTESDFAADLHQIIPLVPQYSPPLRPTDTGGMEMRYDGAVMISDFHGIHYFESGILLPSYTNSMPYDHPLDKQGHIALTHHSGVAAYNSYIGLVATRIPDTLMIEDKDVYQFYPDLVGTVPDPHRHDIWGSLHFLHTDECDGRCNEYSIGYKVTCWNQR